MRFSNKAKAAIMAGSFRISQGFARPKGSTASQAVRSGTTFLNYDHRPFQSASFFWSSNNPSADSIQKVSLEQMEDIIEDYEQGGRKDSEYVVLDVRNVDEINETGKLSPNTCTLPLPDVAASIALSKEDFETKFGFAKPDPDETLVLSCRSGKRAQNAAEVFSKNGYKKVIVYPGSANEWFASH